LGSITVAPLARAYDCPRMSSSCCKTPARWADRHDVGDSRIAITTHGDEATLLLTDDVVALQLSNRLFHDVTRNLRKAEKEDDENVLAQVLKSAVLGSVRALLD